jgi:hypothetical protein
MFTNEGEVALASLLNQALASLPSGLTTDEAHERVLGFIRSNAAFCETHQEWEDTAVREAIWSWVEAPEEVALTEEEATLTLSATIPVSVMTVGGDAEAALDSGDEVHAIFQLAIEEAMVEVKRRGLVTDIGEWSGLEMDID